MKKIIIYLCILLMNAVAIAQSCNITNNSISSASTTICTGTSAQISGTTPSGASTFTYSWLQSTLASSGPYSIIPGQNGITTNTGNLLNNRWYKRIVNISCTPTSTDSDTTAALAIIVQALPTVNVGGAITAICQGATTIALGGGFGGSATGALWSLQTTINGTINSENNPLDASFTAASNAPNLVTLVLTSNGGVCAPVSNTKNITVNPNPNISSSQNQTTCSGTSFNMSPSNGGGNIVPSGTIYTWTIGSNTNITGASTQASGQPSISQTLINTVNISQTISYTITPTAASCAGTSFNANVTVSPKPNVTTSQNQTTCSGTSFTISPANGGGNIVPSGTTYSWTIVSNTNITGASTQTTGQSSVSQTLTNTTNTVQTIIYTITPTAASCAGTSFDATVTVNPKPNVTTTQNQTICSGASFTISPSNGGGNIVPSITTYTWSVMPSALIVGESTVAAGQNNISQLLSNTTNINQAATYSITPTSGQCTGQTFNAIVTVLPTPSISPLSDSICSGDVFYFQPTNGNGNIVPVETTLSWSASNLSLVLGISLNESGEIYVADTLINLNYQNNAIQYLMTPSTASCSGAEFIVTLTILKKPNLISSPDQTICAGQPIQIFSADQFGNQNLFYNWSQSPAISTLNFPYIPNPIASPTSSSNYIVIVIDPTTSCISTDSVYVEVLTVSNINIVSTVNSICEGGSTALNISNLQADWFANGQLIANDIDEIVVSPSVTTTYSAIFNNASCSVEDEYTISVFQNPNPIIAGKTNVCENSYWQKYEVNSSVDHGYTWELENGILMSGQGTNTALVQWFNGTSGSIKVTEHIWESGCEETDSVNVTFTGLAPNPSTVTQLSSGSNILICSDSIFTIYNWGYESKINPGALYVNTHTQYCQFPLFDPTSYYYFVDHGYDETCLTRSYFNTPQAIVSIQETSNKFSCSIFPNPATNQLTLKLDDSSVSDFDVSIYSISGCLVFNCKFINQKSNQLNISTLVNGLYLINIKSNEITYRSRFVKI